jgi:phytoene synthase
MGRQPVESSVDLSKAYAECRRITRSQAKNFYYAFITLPRRERQAIYATYAFCRACDDVADGPLPPSEQESKLQELRGALADAYEGRPRGPIMTALKDSADRFGIDQDYFQEVVSGVSMDLTRSRYANFEELKSYCYKVASVVGLICIEVFRYDDQAARERAVDLGIAMQLTNILRDVNEDYQQGRVYLPQDEMGEFGYSDGDLGAGTVNENFLDLMRFQAGRAREYFDSGSRLIPMVPRRSRACLSVLHGIYGRLLDRMDQQDFPVFNGRFRLGTGEKLLLLLRLWGTSLVAPPYSSNVRR